MNTPELKSFIRHHSNFFWYIPEDKKEDIHPELLLETILNYGSLDDIKLLFQDMGKKNPQKYFLMLKAEKN